LPEPRQIEENQQVLIKWDKVGDAVFDCEFSKGKLPHFFGTVPAGSTLSFDDTPKDTPKRFSCWLSGNLPMLDERLPTTSGGRVVITDLG
jgi:hypothetical protein